MFYYLNLINIFVWVGGGGGGKPDSTDDGLF